MKRGRKIWQRLCLSFTSYVDIISKSDPTVSLMYYVDADVGAFNKNVIGAIYSRTRLYSLMREYGTVSWM